MSRHKSPSYATRIAHAPYNFIPLPDETLSASEHPEWLVAEGLESRRLWECHDRWLEGKYSGWIDLDITALAPLYVRCGVAPERTHPAEPRQNPARQHFFHHGDENEPVIPGSTLRGMTRSLVEIMSRGKLASVSNRTMFYRGVGDTSSLGALYRRKFGSSTPGQPPSSVHAGYLVRKGNAWAIQPAKRHQGESFFRVDYAVATPIIKSWGGHRVHEVWVQPPTGAAPAQIFEKSAPSLERGALVESGHMGKTPFDSANPTVMPPKSEKHVHCVVYERDDAAAPIFIEEETWRLYESDYKMHRDDDRKPRELTVDSPLFYRLDDRGALEFFGPTMMFRLPYENTIRARIGAGSDVIDLAEAMFGMIAGKSIIKGRVIFEAAQWLKGVSPFYEEDGGLKTPRILGAPKPTSFQMYLEQPSPDYAMDLKHWDSSGARVRGRKRYWHRKVADHGTEDSRFEERIRPDSTQHTIVRPVKAGTTFSSRVRFENLNAIEVGALLTALQLPEGSCHQIGMGKPRGMGSARIETKLHLVQRTARSSSPESAGAERVVARYERMLNDDGSLYSGELPRAEADTAARTSREAFESLIAGKSGAFWSLPEMRELDAMLKWDDAPDPAMTKYMDLGPRWRERPVLPLASELGRQPLGDKPPQRRPPPQRPRQPSQRSTRDTHAEPPPPARSPAAETRIVAAGQNTVWKKVRVTLSTDPKLVIRAGRPGGGRPGEATPEDFPNFDEIAERLKNTPGKSATAQLVTIEPRSGRIIEIEW